eukprot:6201003-Pleurochrysis_carterae.AAC.1
MQYLVNLHYSRKPVMVKRQPRIANILRIEVTTCIEPKRSRSSAAHASAGRSQKASQGAFANTRAAP